MSLQRIQEMNILVEPAAASMFEAADTAAKERAINRLATSKNRPLALHAEQMTELLLPEARLLKRAERPNGMSIGDFTAAWMGRFSALQQMLLRRPESSGAISVSAASGHCTLIGQVRTGKCIELEDPTGSIPLITAIKLLPDDVVAVKGKVESGVMHAEEVMFPDVPLREPKNPNLTGTELGRMTDAAGTEWWDFGGVNFLILKADWPGIADRLGTTLTQTPVELLRRRHTAMPPWDVIDPAPDVLVAVGLGNQLSNYKGTRIMGTEGNK